MTTRSRLLTVLFLIASLGAAQVSAQDDGYQALLNDLSRLQSEGASEDEQAAIVEQALNNGMSMGDVSGAMQDAGMDTAVRSNVLTAAVTRRGGNAAELSAAQTAAAAPQSRGAVPENGPNLNPVSTVVSNTVDDSTDTTVPTTTTQTTQPRLFSPPVLAPGAGGGITGSTGLSNGSSTSAVSSGGGNASTFLSTLANFSNTGADIASLLGGSTIPVRTSTPVVGGGTTGVSIDQVTEFVQVEIPAFSGHPI